MSNNIDEAFVCDGNMIEKSNTPDLGFISRQIREYRE